MTISSVTKDGGYLVIVEDGVTKRRSIVYEDTVCSLPPTSYTEIGVIYIDETNSKLVIQYNGTVVEMDLGAASGDVLAAANLTDHAIVRGDGGVKGVQTCGIIVDDSNNISGIVTFTGKYIVLEPVGAEPALTINPGEDEDINIIKLGVTDAPFLQWDESADRFKFTKGLEAANLVSGAGLTVGALSGVLRSDTGVVSVHVVGIADTNLLRVDGSPNDDEFARFTASGLEGRTATEVRSDINVEDGAQVNVYASIAETNTGTEASKSVTPDGLAGSNTGKRTIMKQILADDTALTVADDLGTIQIPAVCNGMNLVAAHAHVVTASSSGLPSFQLYHLDDTQDILTTNITIDENEFSSHTAGTPAGIDTGKDDVLSGERIRVDCDVAGTGTKGLIIELVYQLP